MRVLLALMLLLASPALADKPRIAVDLPAVHALVTQVAGDHADIGFVMRPGASPHGYAMRPSEARLLQEATLVIWIGADSTPWLAHAIETLAPDATSLPLLNQPGTTVLARRDRPVFAEDHDHETHAPDAGEDHDHDHGDADPHAWLDPMNARHWLGTIADALATADPANAAAYRENAAQAQTRLDGTIATLTARLAPLLGRNFIVFHDAYQYFETRFDLPSTAAISPTDASAPGPARLTELRAALATHHITCIFAEPQFDPRLIATLTDGTLIKTAVLDPLGRDIPPGPELYSALLSGLADTMVSCLSGSQ